MLKKSLRSASFFLITIGIFIIIIQPVSITGAAINTLIILNNIWFFIGLGMIFVGTVILVLVKETYISPSHLFVYVPNECINKGIIPGGSDPKEQIVPAFDPKKKTPKEIRKAFGFGGERSLVEIGGSSKKKFYPRLTGPKNKAQGIYGSESYIPAKDIKVVGEDYNIIR